MIDLTKMKMKEIRELFDKICMNGVGSRKMKLVLVRCLDVEDNTPLVCLKEEVGIKEKKVSFEFD